MVAVETMVPLMLDRMCSGQITAERLSWILSEGTARLYGLYPGKGALEPGSDADMTLVDPSMQWTIRGEALTASSDTPPGKERLFTAPPSSRSCVARWS